MLEINVKEAREKFSKLLSQVEQGEEVLIKRHGKKIARLVSPSVSGSSLPSLVDFRASIQVQGSSLSETVIEQREKERY